jgi:putative ATP-dependent endonuclease of OLD family
VYISALKASGFRNLSGTFGLCAPLAVVVGENNSGKSNLVDALRAVLEPEAGPRARHWLTQDDFTHDGHLNPTTEELELEVQLRGLTADERGRMVTCLAPADGPDAAKLRLKARVGTDGRVSTQWYGGDSQHPDVERHAREAVRFVYLHPLRDAAADLRPGRDNKLISLIAALAPVAHPDRDRIVDAVRRANLALDEIDALQNARRYVAARLRAMTGSGRFAHETGLAFDDPEFNRVVSSLRAKIGELEPLDMSQNGLGFNNLLYMAVILAALANPPTDRPTLRVLLVEEPEAHLHPQLQDLLMRFLEEEASPQTQVIVTTHSPSFASSARVDRLTVLARPGDGQPPQARLPREFGLDDRQLAHLRRFLDVTKASLFFARGVVLVEGVAEQLLIPVIAERLQRPLAANGVAVISVGGVAFPPFTDLFGPAKLPYRVAVVSDSDTQPDAAGLEGAPTELSPRAADLAARSTANVKVCLAPHTLEHDLAAAGNVEVMLEALTAVKPRVARNLEASLAAASHETAAVVILENVRDVKGRFAQELADLIADREREFFVPDYLLEAIEWVTNEIEESVDDRPTPTTL